MSITLIGIDDSGKLNEGLTQTVYESDVLCGGKRHLAFFNDFKGDIYTIEGKLVELTKFLEKKLDKKVTVLASGDPLFYGIGAYLSKKIGADQLHIEPAVSSMQVAFARAKISWQDASLTSVHGKPMSNLDEPCQNANVIGVFTDAEHSPQAIAQYVAEKKYGQFDCWVCQNLGSEDESVWEGDLQDTGHQTFSDLNVVILRRRDNDTVEVLDAQSLPLFGIDDNLFNYRAPSKGLITKKEIRVVSLSQMALKKDSIVWDIGAGSGSVSVEAARLCPEGHVYCIEKNKLDYAYISKNLNRFAASNVTAVHGKAPDDIPEDWPAPDAVFVGGSSGTLKELVSLVYAKQKVGATFVVNAITLENQTKAYEALRETGYEVSVQQVNVSRSKPILNMMRFEALNPINIYTGVKK